MARKTDIPCIFCDSLPCVCDGPAKPAKKPVRKAPVEQEVVASQPAPPAEPKSDPFAQASFNTTRFKPAKTQAPVLTEDELITRQAIRNLAPLLSEGERRRHKDILNPPLTASVARRLYEWKARHGKQ